MKKGQRHSPETRAKISAAKKRRSPLAALAPAQRKLYAKLRPILGRAAALREAARHLPAPREAA